LQSEIEFDALFTAFLRFFLSFVFFVVEMFYVDGWMLVHWVHQGCWMIRDAGQWAYVRRPFNLLSCYVLEVCQRLGLCAYLA